MQIGCVLYCHLSHTHLQTCAPCTQWDLGPLNPYGRALIARRELLAIFEKDVAEGRARMARGEEVPGQLGVMLAAMPQSPETDE